MRLLTSPSALEYRVTLEHFAITWISRALFNEDYLEASLMQNIKNHAIVSLPLIARDQRDLGLHHECLVESFIGTC
jgi:hypothetical protein